MFKDFLIFIKKQASSAVFGGAMLCFLILTNYFHVPGFYRYDLLLVLALLTQLFLIIFRFEHIKEALVIMMFHVCAMVMEIFKTLPSVGSWRYPEHAIFAILSVPLFSGFMYSSIGSYVARSWRINEFQFVNLPRKTSLLLISALIYINFFTNHYILDIRWFIFLILIMMFWKTKFYVRLTSRIYSIHPLITNLLLALFVWLGEQIGTFVRVWVYPNQINDWVPVSFHMLTSWYLLLVMSFTLVALVYVDKKSDK